MNKYHNEITVVDGAIFQSKKESARYAELKLLERAGRIENIQRQVKFLLVPSQKDDKGKVIERPTYYFADFTYSQGGKMVVEDVKSAITKSNPVYALKKKLMLYTHNIQIHEV
jgi:hypothetical protein